VGRSAITDNVGGGLAGSIVYQTGAGATTFLGIGSAGYVLTVNSGGTAPQWSQVTDLTAGNATTATHLAGGSQGAMPIQSAPGRTAFIPLGTAGHVLTAGATTATWQAPSTVTVGNSTNLAGGTAGQVPYQSAPNTTAFYGPGSKGQIAVSQGAAAPAYQNTITVTTLSVGSGWFSGATGEIRAENEITAYYSSDARLKENVQLLSNPLEMLEQIRGVRFDWTDSYIESRGGEDDFFVRKHDVGVIAQEVEAILPEIVATRTNGYLAVKYEKLVPLLIEAVKELSNEVKELKNKLK
jgi:hypothetical protein